MASSIEGGPYLEVRRRETRGAGPGCSIHSDPEERGHAECRPVRHTGSGTVSAVSAVASPEALTRIPANRRWSKSIDAAARAKRQGRIRHGLARECHLPVDLDRHGTIPVDCALAEPDDDVADVTPRDAEGLSVTDAVSRPSSGSSVRASAAASGSPGLAGSGRREGSPHAAPTHVSPSSQ